MSNRPIPARPGPYTVEGRPLAAEFLRPDCRLPCERCGELMAPWSSDQFADEAWDVERPDGSTELTHIAHLTDLEIARVARNERDRAEELRDLRDAEPGNTAA